MVDINMDEPICSNSYKNHFLWAKIAFDFLKQTAYNVAYIEYKGGFTGCRRISAVFLRKTYRSSEGGNQYGRFNTKVYHIFT